MTRVAVLLVAIVIAGCGEKGNSASPAGSPPAATSTPSASGLTGAGTSTPATDVEGSSMSIEKAIFASGCFWCTESDFDKVPGVVSTVSGYIGGHVVNPTYNQVSAGGTGHVESVEVTFDARVVTYEQLLEAYWRNVDPFNDRGQFCDFGEQYRPVIWVSNPAQRAAAQASKAQIEKALAKTVVVAIEDAETFYQAETYHQDYYRKNPLRYNYYRWGCGRDARLAEVWGKD